MKKLQVSVSLYSSIGWKYLSIVPTQFVQIWMLTARAKGSYNMVKGLMELLKQPPAPINEFI